MSILVQRRGGGYGVLLPSDGGGQYWRTLDHVVNGVRCWHHPIPKVGNPDVPVLGCGCHPRAGGVWSIVQGSSDLVTLGKSCYCRQMASQLSGYSSTSLSGLQHPDGHPSLDLRQLQHFEKLILLSLTTQIQCMRLNPGVSAFRAFY